MDGIKKHLDNEEQKVRLLSYSGVFLFYFFHSKSGLYDETWKILVDQYEMCRLQILIINHS